LVFAISVGIVQKKGESELIRLSCFVLI